MYFYEKTFEFLRPNIMCPMMYLSNSFLVTLALVVSVSFFFFFFSRRTQNFFEPILFFQVVYVRIVMFYFFFGNLSMCFCAGYTEVFTTQFGFVCSCTLGYSCVKFADFFFCKSFSNLY